MKKSICKILLVIFLLTVLGAVASCNLVPQPGPTPNPQLTQSRVQIVSPPSGVKQFSGVEVKVEQTTLPLYSVMVNNKHSWEPNPTERTESGVGYFSLEGKTLVTVSCPQMTSCVVRPLSAGIVATVEKGVASFTVGSAGTYSVEPDGDATKAIFLFVSPLEEEPQITTKNVVRFERGLHTAANNSKINSSNAVVLSSDTTVILEEGAVVRARFVANNSSNITICGRGVIDGSAFVRNASTGEVTVPLDFNYCSNITFKDFSVLDPAGWCVNWYFCNNSRIDGIKIVTSRSNGDGISLQSCKNITVENCFLRTWDDSLVVKNYPQWSNRNNEGATENILFRNCFVWTDLAQSMEVGYETVGTTFKDVTFENITVLHNFHKPVLSIHNGNNAEVQHITYTNITVEDASMGRGDAGSNNQLCEFAVAFNGTWSNQHKTTALGNVGNVTVTNLTVLESTTTLHIRVAGSMENRSEYPKVAHTVKDVTFQNVWLKNQKLQKSDITANSYTSNVNVVDGQAPVTVPFTFSLTQQQLSTYTDNATVTVL